MASLRRYVVRNYMLEYHDKISNKLNGWIKKGIFNTGYGFALFPDGRTLAGNRLMERNEINEYVKDRIKSSEPFMLARYGSTEANMISRYLLKEKGIIKTVPEERKINLSALSGFFPVGNEELYLKFYEVMKKSSLQADVIGYWQNGMQEMLIDILCRKDVRITRLVNLHPYDFEGEAWTKALEGKRVVVVHPFAKSIEMQYKKRELIWKRNDILPEFNLRCVKAVQTIAGEKDDRFVDWFQALDYMYHEVMSEDFDIAIIGCGAYGMPLAAKIKEAGKQAIHLGGVVQALFGIKGDRFDQYSDFRDHYYNDAWVRPLAEERPQNYKKVENGCYW